MNSQRSHHSNIIYIQSNLANVAGSVPHNQLWAVAITILPFAVISVEPTILHSHGYDYDAQAKAKAQEYTYRMKMERKQKLKISVQNQAIVIKGRKLLLTHTETYYFINKGTMRKHKLDTYAKKVNGKRNKGGRDSYR